MDEELNITKIIAVVDANFAVEERKPKKKVCTVFEPFSPCDTGAVLYQLNYSFCTVSLFYLHNFTSLLRTSLIYYTICIIHTF